MDKISFVIPNNNNNTNNRDDFNYSKIKDDNINEKTSKEVVTKNNINDYVKISSNVYRFNTNNTSEETNIYILYNDGFQERKNNSSNAINIFKKCRELINPEVKQEIKYEIFVNLALLVSEIDDSSEEVYSYYQEALKIYSDRAEPYYYWGMYCNKIGDFEKSYELFKIALSFKYEDVLIKYPETQRTAYDKYLYDEMSVSCYWLKKYNEAKDFLEKIIDDPDFSSNRDRLLENLKFTNEGLKNM